jgi:hypothetical protein
MIGNESGIKADIEAGKIADAPFLERIAEAAVIKRCEA